MYCACVCGYIGVSRIQPVLWHFCLPLLHIHLSSTWLPVWGCILVTPRDSLWLYIIFALITFYHDYKSCGCNPTLIWYLLLGEVEYYIYARRFTCFSLVTCCRLWLRHPIQFILIGGLLYIYIKCFSICYCGKDAALPQYMLSRWFPQQE